MVYVSPQTLPQQFSSFIPVVEITKVTIENSDRGEGLSDFKKEALFDRNPHIDLSRGQEMNLAIVGGVETTQDKHDAYKDWQTQTETSANLIVHLRMKVPRGSSAFPSVMNVESVRKAMRIYCVVYGGSNAEQWLERAAKNNENFMAGARIGSEVSEFEDWSSHPGDEFTDWSSPEQVQQSNGEVVDVYTKTIRVWDSGSGTSTVSTILKNNQNIGITAGASLYPSGGSSGALATGGSVWFRPIRGPVDTLMVIQNGKISSKKIMYDNGRELPPINTSQVQDFRVLAKIESIPLDFSMVEKDLFPDLKSNLSGERIPLNSTYDEFSNIFLSRDIQDNCRFFFSINWKSIILNNSVFGKLIMDANEANLYELITRTRINNLKISRSRVQGNSAVDSSPYYKPAKGVYFDPISSPKTFMENDPPDIVVESSDSTIATWTSERAFGTASPLRAANLITREETDGSSIREHDNFGNEDAGGNSIRHFSCIDQTVRNKSSGYYKYSVEISVIDESVKIVQEKLDTLIGNINTIKEYYDDATKVTTSTGGLPPSYSSHVAAGDPRGRNWGSQGNVRLPDLDYYEHLLSFEREYSRGDINVGGFNSRTGQFSQDFIDTWSGDRTVFRRTGGTVSSQYGLGATGYLSAQTADGWQSIVEPALDSYVNVLKFFFNLGEQEPSLRISLTTLVDPRMATPESIKAVIDTMQTNASKIESVLGVVYSTMPPMSLAESQSPQEKSSVSSKNRLFMVAQESSNIFDSSLPENVGLDFFGTTTPTTQEVGLRQIPMQQIHEVSNQIVAELFGSFTSTRSSVVDIEKIMGRELLNVNMNLLSPKPTYFTPRQVLSPKRNISVSETGNPKDFLRLLPDSLGVMNPATESWLESVLTETEFSRLGQDRKQMLLLANDLASYFALYHSALVEDESGALRNSAKDSVASTKYLPPIEGSMIVKPRAKAYRLLSEIINRIQFGKTKMPNISKISNYVKRENIDFLYNLTRSDSEKGTLRSAFDPQKLPFLTEVTEAVTSPTATSTGLATTSTMERTKREIKRAGRKSPTPQEVIQQVEKFLVNAPIQVKSLIAYTSDPLLVSEKLQQLLSTDNLDMSFDYVSSFQYKTQVINQLEVLDGYGKNSQDGTMLKKPVWKPYKDAAVTSERSYLCRIMPYVNEKYLVDRNKNYDLPTYDEYFIMVT
tara:strand:- start:6008 stop:9550 length:3543 start_codon:yes stop_codon:yes gene_type:complete